METTQWLILMGLMCVAVFMPRTTRSARHTKEQNHLRNEKIALYARLRDAKNPPAETDWPFLNGVTIVYADNQPLQDAWKSYADAVWNKDLNNDAGAAVREQRKEKVMSLMKQEIDAFMAESLQKLKSLAVNDPELKALLERAEGKSQAKE